MNGIKNCSYEFLSVNTPSKSSFNSFTRRKASQQCRDHPPPMISWHKPHTIPYPHFPCCKNHSTHWKATTRGGQCSWKTSPTPPPSHCFGPRKGSATGRQ